MSSWPGTQAPRTGRARALDRLAQARNLPVKQPRHWSGQGSSVAESWAEAARRAAWGPGTRRPAAAATTGGGGSRPRHLRRSHESESAAATVTCRPAEPIIFVKFIGNIICRPGGDRESLRLWFKLHCTSFKPVAGSVASPARIRVNGDRGLPTVVDSKPSGSRASTHVETGPGRRLVASSVGGRDPSPPPAVAPGPRRTCSSDGQKVRNSQRPLTDYYLSSLLMCPRSRLRDKNTKGQDRDGIIR